MNDSSSTTGLRRYPLARRGSVMTTGLDAGEARIPVKDGQLPVYYARPANGTGFPIILVNEAILGINEYIQDVCRRFAKLGYMAVAPEIYFRNPDFPKMTDTQADHARGDLQDTGRPYLVRPRRDACLGRAQSRRWQPDRRDRVLLWRPQYVAICRAQPEA